MSGEKNCILYSLFCMFIVMIIILIRSISSIDIHLVVLLNCPQVFLFVHFFSPCLCEGKGGVTQ